MPLIFSIIVSSLLVLSSHISFRFVEVSQRWATQLVDSIEARYANEMASWHTYYVIKSDLSLSYADSDGRSPASLDNNYADGLTLAENSHTGNTQGTPKNLRTTQNHDPARSFVRRVFGNLSLRSGGSDFCGEVRFKISDHTHCLYSDEEDSDHLIFLTRAGYTSNLGGLLGADAKCQAQADFYGISGTFKAIISDSTTDARDRIVINGPVYEFKSDNLIVDDTADLWDGTINDDIDRNPPDSATGSFVWTGTKPDGTKDSGSGSTANFCGDWTGGGGSVEMGMSSTHDGNWTAAIANGYFATYMSLFNPNTVCAYRINRLYCISQ